ncbi:MAG: hypothetical protein NVSMB63_14680 [Sediminibacterium sp.]
MTTTHHPEQTLVDCERMKYPHTGLYHYCLQLGRALIRATDPVKEELFFLVPPACRDVFGVKARYVLQSPSHKFILPSTKSFKVWHAAHQSTDYYPFQRKIPVILTVHDLNFMHDENKSAKKKKAYLGSLQKKIDRADHIVPISHFTNAELNKYVKLGSKGVSVIYNGCNQPGSLVPNEPALPASRPFLFTIGTIAPKKNFHVLPALLVGNDFQLVIAGITQDAGYKQFITAEANRHGVANRLLFTGGITENDKQWYYQHCEAFVFPSLAEGFGLPVLEAMFYGKPVFLSRAASLPEIGADAAWYFDNFEEAAMRKLVMDKLGEAVSAERTDRIKQRARFFNWDHTAQQYLELYRSYY